ncbi:hypothetical protein ACFXKC_49535 [Streptomyces sp. NPDC059340]|uniref:hypothetical protein n=1 Tax=Streptomyces sp. NPDC059340 TaxID=3346806 RepID=UPI003693493D
MRRVLRGLLGEPQPVVERGILEPPQSPELVDLGEQGPFDFDDEPSAHQLVTGYPVFGLITVDGTLSATAFDPGRLPAPSKATV